MQKFANTDCTTAPRCTTVHLGGGANLSQVHRTAPPPLGGGAVVHGAAARWVNPRNFARIVNTRIFADRTGRSASGASVRFSARTGGTMQDNHEALLNDLLARWHRWSSAPARVADTRMQDFDAVLALLPGNLCSAIQVQARNLAAGAAVWSSVRAGDVDQARAWLRALLADDEDRWFGRLEVQLNERGNRIGESNPKATLPDHDVELLLQLRAEGYTYAWLAAKFEVAKSTVGSWVTGRTRAQAPRRIKKVER